MTFLKHSKTYYRYLLSYMALVVVGALALFIFFQFYFVRNLRENLMDSQQSALHQTALSLDGSLQQINAVDYQTTAFNENFLSYYLSESSPMRDLRIVREFKNLLAPSTFIAEVARYEPKTETIYTSTAVYSAALFFTDIFSFDGMASPADALKSVSSQMVLRATVVDKVKLYYLPEKYLVFVCPPSVFSKSGDAVQLFFVKQSKFSDALSPDGSVRNGAIIDGDGGIVFSTLPLAAAPEGDTARIDGTEYFILREPSAVRDWRYLSIIPQKEGMAPIYRAYSTLFVMLGAILAVGVLVVRYCMRITYTPLKELTLSLGASPQRDDMESLKVVIDTLSSQNETMRGQLMSSPDGQALKDALLFSLLKCKFASFDEFNKEAAPLGMRFDKPYYQVLMLRYFGRDDEEMPREALEKALGAALGADYRYYFRELFEPSMIVCLVGMDESDPQRAAEAFKRLLDVCARDYGLSFTIGVSELYGDIGRLSVACFEANQAVREYFVQGRNRLIRFEDARRPVPGHAGYLNLLENLKTETPAQKMQTIRQFVQLIKDKQTPSLLAKSYCNSAVQLLLSSPASSVKMDDLFAVSYLKTVDDYLAFMLRMLEDDLNAAAPGEIPEATDLLGRIYALLAESYDNCNFSIQETAEKLNLSGSYISQYFKQQTGDTLVNYVSGLRVKKARSLLETTAMPLQMVSESVGYYNLNSFIRRFKQITGVTPGEYRRTYQ